MTSFDLAVKQLKKNGFHKANIGKFNKKFGEMYKNERYYVLVKVYPGRDLDHIINESIEVKNELFSNNHNIWNTYYFVCLEKEVNRDLYYEIEKDVKGIKKHVIVNDNDLDTVPILKNKISHDVPNFNLLNKAEDDAILSQTLKIMEKEGAFDRRFNKNESKELLNKVAKEVLKIEN